MGAPIGMTKQEALVFEMEALDTLHGATKLRGEPSPREQILDRFVHLCDLIIASPKTDKRSRDDMERYRARALEAFTVLYGPCIAKREMS